MQRQELLRKISRLESMLDHLMTERLHLDQMLRSVGFESGLATVKAAASEVASNSRYKKN